MGYFGGEPEPSPYLRELTQARCIQLLANYVSGMQTCLDSMPDITGLERLQADVEAVGQEFYASPEDMQRALQANEGQLLFGALVVEEDVED